MKIKFMKLDNFVNANIPLPEYKTDGSAGMDVRACIKEKIVVKQGSTVMIPLGFAMHIEDKNIAGLKPHELFNMGVLRTFQIAHEFSSLTVLENLMMVPGNQRGEQLIYALFADSAVKKQEEKIRAKAIEVIEFLNLKHLTQEIAGNLSGGQKKLLELGRTMMVEANLVLLDEVGAGVNRTLLNEISDAIIRLNKERNYTFFVIEHDMDLIEKICDPVIVMAEGGVLFEGEFNKVKSNEEVIEAYLGRGIKNTK